MSDSFIWTLLGHLVCIAQWAAFILVDYAYLGRGRRFRHPCVWAALLALAVLALSVLCGVLIGFICGFIGAGGGMMMLLILTSVLGYELKTAVGTSVFIMTFTALTGAVSHFMIGGAPDWGVWVLCVLFTLLWARIAAVFANKATPKTLNRATGVVLVVLGIVIMGFKILA